MQRGVDEVLVLVVVVDLTVVVAVLVEAMVSREERHNPQDGLQTDALTRSVKSVRRKDTQPWIAGIVMMRVIHHPTLKLLQLLHKDMVSIQIGTLTQLQQITLPQNWIS